MTLQEAYTRLCAIAPAEFSIGVTVWNHRDSKEEVREPKVSYDIWDGKTSFEAPTLAACVSLVEASYAVKTAPNQPLAQVEGHFAV